MNLTPGHVYSHPDLATIAFMLIRHESTKTGYKLAVLWVHKASFHEYAQELIKVSRDFVSQLTDNGPIGNCSPLPVFNMGSDYVRRYSTKLNS